MQQAFQRVVSSKLPTSRSALHAGEGALESLILRDHDQRAPLLSLLLSCSVLV